MQFTVVLFLTNDVHIVDCRIVSDERFIDSFWCTEHATNVLHLVLRADVQLVLAVFIGLFLIFLGDWWERIARLAGQKYPIFGISVVWFSVEHLEEFCKNAACTPDVYFCVILLLHENNLWRPVEPRDYVIRQMSFTFVSLAPFFLQVVRYYKFFYLVKCLNIFQFLILDIYLTSSFIIWFFSHWWEHPPLSDFLVF